MGFINDLELEASCRIFDAGGSLAGIGAGYGGVSAWLGDLGDMLPPARDGKASCGKLDRVGRPLQAGRGQGLFDDMVPVTIVEGAIVEMVPVSIKGSKGKGYGNRDLTLHYKVPTAMAEAGIPLWVILLREIGGELQMRRINASGVINAQNLGELPPETVKIRDDARRWVTKRPSKKADTSVWNSDAKCTDDSGRITQVGGYENVKDYTRFRIEWARVAKHRPDLWLDSDWVAFDATAPIPIHYV